MAAGMGQQRTVLTMYAISAVMGIAAVLFSRDLFLETGGLFLIAVTLIYIFLTDATVLLPTLKGVNVRKIERREKSEEVQLQESVKEKIEQVDSEEREIEEIQNREGGI
jgi:UDP-GlcNAc:undecaprenyl-phosphate GlcNAc-1-phosphate transferase